MHIGDWLNSVPYNEKGRNDEMRISELVNILEHIGIKLQADEKFVLLNFISQQMSEIVTKEELIKCAHKSGVRTYD